MFTELIFFFGKIFNPVQRILNRKDAPCLAQCGVCSLFGGRVHRHLKICDAATWGGQLLQNNILKAQIMCHQQFTLSKSNISILNLSNLLINDWRAVFMKKATIKDVAKLANVPNNRFLYLTTMPPMCLCIRRAEKVFGRSKSTSVYSKLSFARRLKQPNPSCWAYFSNDGQSLLPHADTVYRKIHCPSWNAADHMYLPQSGT